MAALFVGRRLGVLALLLSFITMPPAGANHPADSQVTAVTIDRTEDVGRFGGVAFERVLGHVEGQVHRSEDVVGLAELLGDREFHPYRSEFELIRPVDPARRRLAVVEVENRGSPLMLQMFDRFVIGFSGPPSKTTYPAALGDGFLFDGLRSYARVQWQVGISPGVPETAQGVGEVIVRDFGRLLRTGRVGNGPSPLGRYRALVLAGISQSGWFIDTFLAEGFNADPSGRRVYDGALALASGGNWLAINRLGHDGQPQQPYVRPDGRPLPASEILTRPRTDAVFVDAVTYTDFYRLRAALAREDRPPRRSHRYELPAAHLPAFFVNDEFVFGTLGCNDKQVVPLSPLDYRPYLRALLVGLEGELGFSGGRLPPPALFELGGEPSSSPHFNDLPDTEVRVPQVDSDAQPEGGLRFPEVDLPLGRLQPPAIPPVTASSITAICGNFGGYQPFTTSELEARYGSVDQYEARVRPLLRQLVRCGLLLADDAESVVGDLRHRYEAAPA
jgi:hypothetical protein